MKNLLLDHYTQVFEKNKKSFLKDFFTYLRFESISTQKDHHKDAIDCAKWLKKRLEGIDLDVELWKTPSLPTLFAQNLKAGPDHPTILIYLHYDVQPVDPINLWDSPPFEPEIRDGNIYARGACDNKGQAFYTLCALQAVLEKKGSYPVNLKIVIEGEEECGSAGLLSILEEKKSDLKADYLLIVDIDIPSMEHPTVNLGCRGIITSEITLKGSYSDLHSGLYGGIVTNPLNALCQILASFHDSKGRVQIPGFYDSIQKLSSAEKKDLFLDFNEDEFLKTHGCLPNGGEKGYTPLERMGLRPTFDVNGIWGGYTEPGFKTVIPSTAHAKVSMRLVPNQDPYHILESFTTFIHSLVPDGLTLSIATDHEPAAPLWCNFDSKIVALSIETLTEIFNIPCKKYIGGGSLPIALKLQQISGSDAIGLGLSLPGDQIHAPNEHFSVERFQKGFLMIALLLEKLEM